MSLQTIFLSVSRTAVSGNFIPLYKEGQSLIKILYEKYARVHPLEQRFIALTKGF